jgi:hypothetical protein
MSFKTQVKRITALPFLPLEDISDAWDKIYAMRTDDGINGAKNKYMRYVYNTWIKDNSTFNREVWNHFKNFNKRTTNDLESWHNIFNRTVGKTHANIFEFINALKSEQQKFESKREFLNIGNSPNKVRRKYAKINEKLLKLTEHYEDGRKDALEFLETVGFLFKLKTN